MSETLESPKPKAETHKVMGGKVNYLPPRKQRQLAVLDLPQWAQLASLNARR